MSNIKCTLVKSTHEARATSNILSFNDLKVRWRPQPCFIIIKYRHLAAQERVLNSFTISFVCLTLISSHFLSKRHQTDSRGFYTFTHFKKYTEAQGTRPEISDRSKFKISYSAVYNINKIIKTTTKYKFYFFISFFYIFLSYFFLFVQFTKCFC